LIPISGKNYFKEKIHINYLCPTKPKTVLNLLFNKTNGYSPLAISKSLIND